MSVLSKDRNIAILPGVQGTTGVPARPYKSGYYTTVNVPYYELIDTPVAAGPSEATPTEVSFIQDDPTEPTEVETIHVKTTEEKYSIRLATYKEIETHLWKGSNANLCGIRAHIMETINNTEFQLTPLHTFYKFATYQGNTVVNNHILTVAYLEQYDATGICYAEQVPGQPWETDIRNPTYDFIHPTEEFEDDWKFEDHYTCSIVNGVEEMVKI